MNLLDILGEELYSLISYNYTVYDKFAVKVEGHRGIKLFSDTKISLSLKGKLIEIMGQNLKINYLTKDCCLIVGKVNEVKVI